MYSNNPNVSSAVENIDYYNGFWLKAGKDRHYTEINRVRFAVDTIRKIQADSETNILDFGCGMGWMAPFLSPLGKVTGIDFSPEGIEIARSRYGEHAKFILANPQSPTLGLPDNVKFDVVVCSEVIEHVEFPFDLMAQISSLLRGGGWCVLTTPNGNVWPQFDRDLRYKADQQPIENWLTTKQVEKLFLQSGFRIASHEGRPLYEFRHGLSGVLQRHRINTLFQQLGLGRLYGKLILPTALYQVVAAQKL